MFVFVIFLFTSVILRLCCFIRNVFEMFSFMASEQRPFNPQGFLYLFDDNNRSNVLLSFSVFLKKSSGAGLNPAKPFSKSSNTTVGSVVFLMYSRGKCTQLFD